MHMYIPYPQSIAVGWRQLICYFYSHLLCPMFLPLLLHTYKFTEDNTFRHFSFKFDFAFKGLIFVARAKYLLWLDIVKL